MLNLIKLSPANCLRGLKTLPVSYYKSDISLDKLYPNSKLNITTPPLPKPNTEKFSGVIPLDQVQISYERASGPGGQNVNKVATKVDLRFHVANANWISDAVKQRLQQDHKTKINKDGFFVIKSDVTRYQQMNLADALEKLRNLIRDAEKIKRPEMTAEALEKIRKRQENAAMKRIAEKRITSITKEGRRAPSID